MKTATTIDVTVPENRKLELELPLEVPAGKAKKPRDWPLEAFDHRVLREATPPASLLGGS
ncbi:MAG: hypothetical protein IT375_17060 [Polyangiaceae bacterium]|nr:hypothetical protein [Polyangiaceae bacterium]